MRQVDSFSQFFVFAVRVLKYFLLGLVGATVVYVLSEVFGISVVSDFLITFVERVLARLCVLILSLGATAVVVETLRH